MSIDLVKIRAKIVVGGTAGVTVVTPYIQSFSVRKSRGQLSSFDASLKVKHSEISSSNLGGEVIIYAGANGSLHRIYTGLIKKSTVSPCWDDPGYVLFNISGTDVLSYLQGKKYTRRCRATKSSWVSINNVTRPGLRDGKFDREFGVLATDSGSTTKAKEVISAPVLAKGVSVPASPGVNPILVNISQVPTDEEPPQVV